MQIGLGLWLGTRQVGGFSPATLFAAGEQGGWYDSSDLSTMFQDTAGTVPVTATGQTVARINDKSGRGNHLTQATAASRPIYGIEPFGGRRNLLTWTQEFDNAAWLNIGGQMTNRSANATVAPDATNTADLVWGDLAKFTALGPAISQAYIAGQAWTYSIYVKRQPGSPYGFVRVNLDRSGGNNNCVIVNLDSGAFTLYGTADSPQAAVQDVGNGWYRVSHSLASLSTSGTWSWNNIRFFAQKTSSVSENLSNGDGVSTCGIFIWGAQFETGSTATAYQAVTDQWNVTEAGVPSVSYVQYDGTDDWFVSPTITPGIDKAQVFAGVRKLSDADGGMVAELSETAGGNTGAIALQAPHTVVNSYRFISKGTMNAPVVALGFPAPTTSVLVGLGDISGDTSSIRVNGTQVEQSTADQGTGNYLAYPLYVGRRAGTTLPFNGRLYQLLVRFGANLDAATIAATETFTNSKTGAYV